jgi:hypothetical protein
VTAYLPNVLGHTLRGKLMHTLMGLVFASERHRAMPLRCVGNSSSPRRHGDEKKEMVCDP